MLHNLVSLLKRLGKPTRSAWKTLQSVVDESWSRADSTNSCSYITYRSYKVSTSLPISRAQQSANEYGYRTGGRGVTNISEELRHKGGILKGHFNRCLPLGTYEAYLKQDGGFFAKIGSKCTLTSDPIDPCNCQEPWGSVSSAIPSKAIRATVHDGQTSLMPPRTLPSEAATPKPVSSFTADDERGGGVALKWNAGSSESGLTLRADPLEWFQHHISKLVQDSRVRTPVTLSEEKFLRQLISEQASRDNALCAYKGERESAEKRGQLGDLQPVKKQMSLWMPALEQAIASDQMLASGSQSLRGRQMIVM